MRAKVATGVGIVLATLAAGSAQAATPELSVTERLQDRREVAAGTRAQVLGFQDGRFYANGWHTTGEMGGIVTPPLKLLDSVYFGVDGSGSARRRSSRAAGATSATSLPSIDGFGCGAPTSCPTARAARCSGSS